MVMKLVQGKVEQISMRPIAGGPDRFDNNFRKSMKVDGVWYGFGGAKKDQWNVKIGAEFFVLGVGSTVAFQAEQNGDFWNGKNLMVMELVEGQAGGNKPAAQASGGGGGGAAAGGFKKDMTGVSTGHALNGAMNFLIYSAQETSNENIIRYASSVHNVTEKLKASNKVKYPELSEYDLGAMVGNSILNAAKIVPSDGDFEAQLAATAQDLIDNVVPVVTKYVREGKGAAPAPRVTRPSPAAKKPAASKARQAPPADPVPAPEDADRYGDPEDGDDSDIPF